MSVLSEDLRLFTTNGGTQSRIDVAGELDLASVGLLRDHLAMIIESGIGDVDVDMSAVSFCDSTGVCTLLEARQQLLTEDRRLRVINPSKRVSRTFELAGVSNVLVLPP